MYDNFDTALVTMMNMKVIPLEAQGPYSIIHDNFDNFNNIYVAGDTFGDQGPPSSTLPHPVSSVAVEVE